MLMMLLLIVEIFPSFPSRSWPNHASVKNERNFHTRLYEGASYLNEALMMPVLPSNFSKLLENAPEKRIYFAPSIDC